MPPPLEAVAVIAQLPAEALSRRIDLGGGPFGPTQFHLYHLLRGEQALAVEARGRKRPEVARILDLAQSAYGELAGLLVGRDDALLDVARDGDWTLRNLLRHAIAVECRYAAQVGYAATRQGGDPLAIPIDRLPCDRLSPPEPAFGATRTAGLSRVVELLGAARDATGERLADLPETSLDRPSLWSTLEMPIRMRMHQIAAHLTEVVIQSEKMLGADASGPEPRRIVRHCCVTRGAHELASDPGARAHLDERYREIARASA